MRNNVTAPTPQKYGVGAGSCSGWGYKNNYERKKITKIKSGDAVAMTHRAVMVMPSYGLFL